MKRFAPLLTVGLLLVGAMLSAQEAKPKTYTLVLEGAV
jgi:hypothetical protein